MIGFAGCRSALGMAMGERWEEGSGQRGVLMKAWCGGGARDESGVSEMGNGE